MTGSAAQHPARARKIFIDALNLAYWCGAPPSLRAPVVLLTQLLARGDAATLYFDASARHRLRDEVGLYVRLLEHPDHVVEVPSGRSADRVMLRHATSSGACVVSRDKYRDHRRRFRKLIDDPTRLVSGAVADDFVLVPALALRAPLPASAQEALARLEVILLR